MPLAGLQLTGLALLAAILVGFAIWIVLRLKATPEKRERKRRLAVNERGRLGDGTISDVAENALFYSYSVRGVIYNASQDISTLRDIVSDDPALLIGHVTLKYATNNPANSIVVCEEWSGLRTTANKELDYKCEHGM